MMDHDATHCGDYIKGICPETCYRAQLTEDFNRRSQEFVGVPLSWAGFFGTDECPKPASDILGKYAMRKLCEEKAWEISNMKMKKPEITINLDDTAGIYVIFHGEKMSLKEYVARLMGS